MMNLVRKSKGLVLSLGYDIVNAHGGTITINSNYCPPGGELKVETREGEGLYAKSSSDAIGYGRQQSAQTGTTFIIQLPI